MTTADNKSDVLYQKLRENGVCHICSKRYVCSAECNEIIEKEWFEVSWKSNRTTLAPHILSILFNDVLSTILLQEHDISSDGDKIKIKKSNPCIICMDVFSDSVVEVVEKLVRFLSCPVFHETVKLIFFMYDSRFEIVVRLIMIVILL